MSINPRDRRVDALTVLISDHPGERMISPRDAAETLLDRGWRPPPRVIDHADRLSALPVGSVVLHSPCADSSACVWVKDVNWWWTTDGDTARYDEYDIEGHLDAGETLTVLHEPEEAR